MYSHDHAIIYGYFWGEFVETSVDTWPLTASMVQIEAEFLQVQQFSQLHHSVCLIF